jgi:hypothetical protein
LQTLSICHYLAEFFLDKNFLTLVPLKSELMFFCFFNFFPSLFLVCSRPARDRLVLASSEAFSILQDKIKIRALLLCAVFAPVGKKYLCTNLV